MWKNICLIGLFCCSFASIYGAGCSSKKKDVIIRKKPAMHKRQKVVIPKFRTKETELNLAESYPSYLPGPKYCTFLMNGELLFMRSRNESIIYAYESKNIETDNFLGNFVKQGKMLRPNNIWKPGFTVGIGIASPYQFWDTQAHWMYYYNQTKDSYSMDPVLLDSSNANANEGFWPYWVVMNDTQSGGGNLVRGYYQGIAATWKLVYNILDWTLGRSFELVNKFKLRPHMGVKGGWIHQKVEIEYSTAYTNNSTAANIPRDAVVKQNNNYWGIGITAGVNSHWELGAGFYLKSLVSSSILSGRTNVRRIQDDRLPGNNLDRTDNQTDRVIQFAPNMDMSLGIGWQICPQEGTQTFGFDISWQSIYWWNQFDFYLPRNGLAETTRNQIVMEYSSKNKPLNIEGGIFNFYYWF